MSKMARAGILCSCGQRPAGAADLYSVREAVPETGSNIAEAPPVHWPVPVNKTYAELSGDEQRQSCAIST